MFAIWYRPFQHATSCHLLCKHQADKRIAGNVRWTCYSYIWHCNHGWKFSGFWQNFEQHDLIGIQMDEKKKMQFAILYSKFLLTGYLDLLWKCQGLSQICMLGNFLWFLVHLSQRLKVSNCDRSLSVVLMRPFVSKLFLSTTSPSEPPVQISYNFTWIFPMMPSFRNSINGSATPNMTGPRSALSNVSGYSGLSDCRSRGRKFDPSPVPYFHGDWSWNNFYGHSLPFCWFIQEGFWQLQVKVLACLQALY